MYFVRQSVSSVLLTSVVTVIETGTETAFFFAEPNRNRGFMPLY